MALIQVLYHIYWSVNAVLSHKYGSKINTIAVAGGTLALNAFLTSRVLLFFETRLLSNQIDADHKKYL